MSMRCGRLQMIPPLGGGGEKEPESLFFAMQQLLWISGKADKLQFLNLLVRKTNHLRILGLVSAPLRATNQ